MATASTDFNILRDTPIFNGDVRESTLKKAFPYNKKGESLLDMECERIKSMAALFSLMIFNPNKVDAEVKPGIRFTNLVSEDKCGRGVTRPMSMILGYLLAFNEANKLGPLNKNLYELSQKVDDAADRFFGYLTSGHYEKLIEATNVIKEFDNYPIEYERVYLNHSDDDRIPDNILCEIKERDSGHLVAEVGEEYSDLLFEIYQSQIEEKLTEGTRLEIPQNRGHVIIVYNHELRQLDSQTLQKLDRSQKVTVSLGLKYIVPVRGIDNRYTVIAATLVDSEEINEIRRSLGLNPFEDKMPPRLTYGVVSRQQKNSTLPYSSENLGEVIKDCSKIQDLLSKV